MASIMRSSAFSGLRATATGASVPSEMVTTGCTWMCEVAIRATLPARPPRIRCSRVCSVAIITERERAASAAAAASSRLAPRAAALAAASATQPSAISAVRESTIRTGTGNPSAARMAASTVLVSAPETNTPTMPLAREVARAKAPANWPGVGTAVVGRVVVSRKRR